jgi:hypothetical protein
LALALSLASAAVRPAQTQQPMSEAALKAAFLVNFARFTDWPPGDPPAAADLTFCVYDPAVHDALAAIAAGQTVGARRLAVVRIAVTEAVPRVCSLAYFGGLSGREAQQVAQALRGTAVLSVGDSADFTRAGGIIHFFLEGGRMRFAVNIDAAERARLRLSSKLLSLARIVRG